MSILSIAIAMFAVLETLNVIMLYFTPGTRKGNGVGVFNAYEKSKADPEVHALITYLINWVAGTKLIFIILLVVILITGNSTTKLFSVIGLILSILSFYWRLYPAIKSMDNKGNITPKGYSKTLGVMIAGFIGIFLIALGLYVVL
ncbi:MAG: hypothetical protein DRP58_12385 [Spirochaetes bacterium]|nr:MAG: hypothetical protein DRP58_12385 [Spirochaetota bacterium]